MRFRSPSIADRFRSREDQSPCDHPRERRLGGATGRAAVECDVPAVPTRSTGPPDTCVRVDAFRNQARGNALPMFFGNLVGVSSQGVRATATAQIVSADTTECRSPGPSWIDGTSTTPREPSPTTRTRIRTTASSTFDKYSDGKGTNPPRSRISTFPPVPHRMEPGFACRMMKVAGSRSRSATTATRFRRVGSGRFACRDSMERTEGTYTARTSRAATGCRPATPNPGPSARPALAMTTPRIGRRAGATRWRPATRWVRQARGSKRLSHAIQAPPTSTERASSAVSSVPRQRARESCQSG